MGVLVRVRVAVVVRVLVRVLDVLVVVADVRVRVRDVAVGVLVGVHVGAHGFLPVVSPGPVEGPVRIRTVGRSRRAWEGFRICLQKIPVAPLLASENRW